MLLTEEGISSLITIDGADMALSPDSLMVDPQPQQTIVETLDARSTQFSLTAGTGHADKVERYNFDLPYELISDGATRAALERIRTKPGHRTFCYWKMIPVYYTARAAQTFFYLPKGRRDAPAVLSRIVAGDLVVSVNGVSKTVVRQASVAVGDAVTAGSVWVSTAIDSTGYAPFKFGTALAANDLVEVQFIPLFDVYVESAPTTYRTVTEGRGLRLVER